MQKTFRILQIANQIFVLNPLQNAKTSIFAAFGYVFRKC
ncbi:hypothetical protein PLUTE_b0943 [Pseudoalteromonas luteoviolacea DSM 6061]|nr:hypothetical protein [Pseudoalteromonas luteoviolacea DSM 6061]